MKCLNNEEIKKKSKKLTSEDKEKIITAVLRGQNVQKLSEEYKCTQRTINDLLRPHYKLETITSQQRKTIIKFGFYLQVPVDYMAEYVKCSEHKCTEVLNKFKKKFMSTNHDAMPQNLSRTY